MRRSTATSRYPESPRRRAVRVRQRSCPTPSRYRSPGHARARETCSRSPPATRGQQRPRNAFERAACDQQSDRRRDRAEQRGQTKAADASAKIRRSPKMSPRDPTRRISEPSVKRYALLTHCCPARPPPRLRWIDGSATLTTLRGIVGRGPRAANRLADADTRSAEGGLDAPPHEPRSAIHAPWQTNSLLRPASRSRDAGGVHHPVAWWGVGVRL
jgi:hypothetical protein